jgi:hypothetical protein
LNFWCLFVANLLPVDQFRIEQTKTTGKQ